MRKNTILISIILIIVLVSPMSMVVSTKDNTTFVNTAAKSLPVEGPSVIHSDRASYYNDTWAQLTTTAFTPDGNITEWGTEGIISETFGGAEVYLAYDATNAYVAVTWEDNTFSTDTSKWNKTDAADGFEMLQGADDIINVGFHNGSYADFWTWTASNRTASNYAFDHSWNDTIDGGTLPYVMNTNGTDFTTPNAPYWDNTWTPIVDYSAIPISTEIYGWYPDETIPTGSQADVAVGWNYTGTHYVVEFVRLLDTGQVDDIVLDFTNNDLFFEFGVEDENEAVDFETTINSYLICHENAPAELTFNTITSEVNEALLLQGTAFDDYRDYYVDVWADEWDHTWGTPDIVNVNKITGTWSYLLLFNEMDLPLGQINIFITLYPRYDEAITLNQTTEVEDINEPNIIGLVDIDARFPTGVPKDEGYVTVTVGLMDDYSDVNDLTANLYWYKDEGIALAVPMTQFYLDSSTFQGNITIDPSDDYSIQHNYTYFVQAWDTSGNKVVSTHLDFFTETTGTNPTTTTITPTTIITGIPFNAIIGSLIFSGCLIIIIRFKKRRTN